jgi:hypothetical protein
MGSAALDGRSEQPGSRPVRQVVPDLHDPGLLLRAGARHGGGVRAQGGAGLLRSSSSTARRRRRRSPRTWPRTCAPSCATRAGRWRRGPCTRSCPTSWSDLGYVIAIEPSPVTVRSIEAGFGFTPAGHPGRRLAGGPVQAGAEVDIRAEEFCLACHSEANIGDTLGTVTVRNYLASDFALWFDDLRHDPGASRSARSCCIPSCCS